MSAEQLTTIITGVIQSGAILFFVYIYIRSLRTKIGTLQVTVDVQKETLSTMERRINETERIGDIYKRLIEDLPKDLDNYKAIISKTKDETIVELQKTTEKQESEINRLRVEVEHKIKGLNIREEKIQKSLKIMNVLYSSDSNDANSLFKSLGVPYEKMIPIIIDEASFEGFLTKAGYAMEINDNINVLFKMMSEKNNELQSVTMSLNGSYAMTRNNKVLMDTIRYNNMNSFFEMLKTIQ